MPSYYKKSTKMIIKKTLILSLLIAFASVSRCQDKWFPDEELITTGVYYYPEHWPQEQWERDIQNMALQGFEWVHLAEFAWAMLEPEEGVYTFEWLDKVVGLCDQNGMKVVLSTPSATPPVWMARKYPEILITNKDGSLKEIGHRQHGSPSSDKFRELTYRYLEVMGTYFKNDPRILGWQIYNEQKGWADYGENAEHRFRAFLEKKYLTVDALNKAWGTSFWSMTYPDFTSVKIPTQAGNLHHLLDWKRFQSDEMTTFMAEQKAVLEKYLNEDQWVTTNFIPNIGNINPKASETLDFLCYTRYLAHGYTSGTGDRGFRRGFYLDIPFSNDYHRPFKGTTGVMELQPGQVNWGNNYNPQTEPGTVRMWLWHSYAGGSDFACTYRYRQPLYGSEQYHYGIVRTDGVTLSPGGKDFVTFMDEIKALRKEYDIIKTKNKDWDSRQAAILVSYDNRWETELQKQTKQWNQTGHLFSHYYKWLKSFGAPVDFISERDDFTKYPILLAPAYQLLDKKLVNKWTAYVEQGGHLVLSVRTGQKDRSGILWEGDWAEPIHELSGAKIEFFDLLPPVQIESNDGRNQLFLEYLG